MAFRKKGSYIHLEQPDILIIPECEHPDKLAILELKPTSTLWFGSNKNKGIAIFSFGSYNLNSMDFHNPELKLICPISVTGGKVDFTLLAVWANNPQDKDYQYIGQVWKAIHYYEDILKSEKTIIAGDFNSNVIWDKSHRKASHSMMVEKLGDINIFSTYHRHFQPEQGKESHPTFHLFRHENKPYHIDYCFVSRYFIDKLKNVQVGSYNDWTHLSDHKPLIVTFNI